MLELAEKERVYLLKRRHHIVLQFQIFPLLLILFLISCSILFLFFKEINWPQFLAENFPQLLKFRLNFILIFFFSLTLPILWSLIFLIITQYYLTYWVITNQRIISAKLVGLFNVKYVSIYLDKIQDLTVSIKGILPSIYHFGNLRIQTAGEKGQFLLDQIQDPEIVKQVIFEAKRDYLRELKKL
jgi:hypothetical protein